MLLVLLRRSDSDWSRLRLFLHIVYNVAQITYVGTYLELVAISKTCQRVTQVKMCWLCSRLLRDWLQLPYRLLPRVSPQKRPLIIGVEPYQIFSGVLSAFQTITGRRRPYWSNNPALLLRGLHIPWLIHLPTTSQGMYLHNLWLRTCMVHTIRNTSRNHRRASHKMAAEYQRVDRKRPAWSVLLIAELGKASAHWISLRTFLVQCRRWELIFSS